MDEADKLHLIAGALVLGFTDLGDDEFKCTKEQLSQLCTIVASSAISQMEDALNGE